MHKAGSYTEGSGSVSCEARIRNRRGIAVARMPSASIFRPIRLPSSDCRSLTASGKGWLPFFAPFFATTVDTVIYDFLLRKINHEETKGTKKEQKKSSYSSFLRR